MAEWLQNPLVVIGIAIAAMFFGYFFGLFEGRGQGYKKRQKEEAEDKKLVSPAEPLPPASPPVPSDEISILDVSMAPDGELRLKVDGQHLDTSALGAEQRKRLVAILTQMRPWLEAPKSAPPAPPQPRSGREPIGAIRPVSSPQRAPVASTPSLSPKAPPAPASQPANDEDEPAPVPQSIVAQIDSVLQARLARTPLAEKGIRLQESRDGGVIVWVGIDKYGGIDDVPDDEIKAALRAAIADWENKFTPGL
jgi:hypothetical protein